MSTLIPLTCNPGPTNTAVGPLHLGARAVPQDDGKLLFHFELAGDLDALLVPGQQLPVFADELWKHTCFEAFIAVVGEPAYREFNFSPSGQWAAYAFSDYRERKAWQINETPAIRYAATNNRLTLEATITKVHLPNNPLGKSYRLGLAAVLETKFGELSYWALKHPSSAPDFHHRDGFILAVNI